MEEHSTRGLWLACRVFGLDVEGVTANGITQHDIATVRRRSDYALFWLDRAVVIGSGLFQLHTVSARQMWPARRSYEEEHTRESLQAVRISQHQHFQLSTSRSPSVQHFLKGFSRRRAALCYHLCSCLWKWRVALAGASNAKTLIALSLAPLLAIHGFSLSAAGVQPFMVCEHHQYSRLLTNLLLHIDVDNLLASLSGLIESSNYAEKMSPQAFLAQAFVLNLVTNVFYGMVSCRCLDSSV